MLAEHLSNLVQRLDLTGSLLELGGGLAAAAARENNLPYSACPSLDALLDSLAGLTGPVTVCLAATGDLEAALARLAAAPEVGGLLLVGPNPAHQDILAGLAAGQLPERQFRLDAFSQAELTALARKTGWRLAQANHVAAARSSAYDPASLLHRPTLAGDVLRAVAANFNPAARISEWVWYADRAVPTAAPAGPVAVEDPAPVISILIRTQGLRLELLTQGLYSIYAQDCPPGKYEVVIALQAAEPATGPDLAGFERWLQNFPPELAARIRVLPVTGQGAVPPCNPLLRSVRGDYFFFLDDDDLLIDGCLPLLLDAIDQYGADYPVIQTLPALGRATVTPWPLLVTPEAAKRKEPDRAGLTVEGKTYSDLFADPDALPRTYPYTLTGFDLSATGHHPVGQYYHNSVPLSNYALPRKVLEQARLAFDPEMGLYAGWDFVMKALRLLKVVSLPVYTTVLSRRDNNSQLAADPALAGVREEAYRRCLERWRQQPVVLDGPAVDALAGTWRTIDRLQARVAEGEALLQEQAARCEAQRQDLESRLDWLQGAVKDLEQARDWQAKELNRAENELKALQATRTVRLSRALGALARRVKRAEPR